MNTSVPREIKYASCLGVPKRLLRIADDLETCASKVFDTAYTRYQVRAFEHFGVLLPVFCCCTPADMLISANS